MQIYMFLCKYANKPTKKCHFWQNLSKNGNFDISTYQNTQFANFAPFLQNGISIYTYYSFPSFFNLSSASSIGDIGIVPSF